MFIDIVFAILVVLAVLKGFSRGLIVALFSFAAIIIGLAAAMKFSTAIAGWLENSTHITKQWLPFIAFILVMIGVVIVIRIVANIIQKAVEVLLMGWINKLGGVILYLALYITVYSVLLFYVTRMHLLTNATIETSKTYAFIETWGPKAVNGFSFVIPFFKDMFAELEHFFQSFAEHIK